MRFIVTIFFFILLFSCGEINVSERKGKDIILDDSNFHLVNQTINSLSNDSTELARLLLDEKYWFNYDSIKLESTYPDIILFNFFQEDLVIHKQERRVSFDNGYLVLKDDKKKEFEVGPLLWSISEHIIYLGLTKNEDLVELNYRGGTLFCLFFPYMSAVNQNESIYSKI